MKTRAETVKNRIRKVHALTASPVRGEAEAAKEKLDELIERYGIDPATITNDNPPHRLFKESPAADFSATMKPSNPTTGRAYGGNQAFDLAFIGVVNGWHSGHWAGFHQWRGIGRQVRKWQRGTRIWLPVFVSIDEDEENEKVLRFKRATVFAYEQTEPMRRDGSELVPAA